MVVLSLAVPVLCVSRFQLILAVGMAAFTYISMSGTFSLVYVGVLMACMIPAYLLLTVYAQPQRGIPERHFLR